LKKPKRKAADDNGGGAASAAKTGAAGGEDKQQLGKLSGLAHELMEEGDYEIYEATFEKLAHELKMEAAAKVRCLLFAHVYGRAYAGVDLDLDLDADAGAGACASSLGSDVSRLQQKNRVLIRHHLLCRMHAVPPR
jgi:hypothetical protein